MVDAGGCLAGCLLVLGEAGVVGGEDADVFDDDFVGLGGEAVDFEAAEGEHFVGGFAVVDGDEVGEELLLGGEGVVGGDPVLGVAHLNVIINCPIIIRKYSWLWCVVIGCDINSYV